MSFWLAIIAWVTTIAVFALNRTLVPATSTRFMIYLLGIPVVACIAAVTAGAGDACPADATDCDLTGLAGLFVGGIVLLAGFGAAIVFEGVRAFLAAADRHEQR